MDRIPSEAGVGSEVGVGWVRRLVTRWGAYRGLRVQLGSVRKVYLANTDVQRHEDFDGRREVVLLLHGFFQTRNIWEVMEDRLRFDGYAVMSFNLGGLFWRFNTHPVDQTARLIAHKIEALSRRHGFDALHIVGHSKGGLIARHYVQHYGGDKRVKSVTTLGTPHHGTPTALLGVGLMSVVPMSTSATDMLPWSRVVRKVRSDTFPAHIPLTSLYSKNDLVCPYWCSILRPRPGESSMSNIVVGDLGHSELTWDPGVYRIVRQRLEEAARLHSERQARATAPLAAR